MTSISVVSGDITATSIDEQWMADFMAILTDVESTSQPSINEDPNVKEYITINFNCSDGSVKTVLFYEKNGEEYVEQTYQGIYMPAPELGEKITELLESQKHHTKKTNNTQTIKGNRQGQAGSLVLYQWRKTAARASEAVFFRMQFFMQYTWIPYFSSSAASLGRHRCTSLHSFICSRMGTKLSASSVRVYSTLGGISW